MGETRGAAAFDARPDLLDALALTEAERALVAIEPGYPTREHGVAARRVHAARRRCSSPSTTPSRPRGLATPRRWPACSTRWRSWRVPRAVRGDGAPADGADARGAARQLSRVGRHGESADDRDRRLPRRADLDRVRDAAGALRTSWACRPSSCDPRDLTFDGTSLVGRRPRNRSGLSPRASSTTSSSGRTTAGRWSSVRRARGVRRQHVAVQDAAQEGVLRGAHRRRASATCSTPQIARASRPHVPWTRLVQRRRRPTSDGETIDLLPHVRAHRDRPGDEAERRLRRHGVDAGLGGRRGGVGRHACRALGAPRRAWVVQEKIPVRREVFPRFDAPAKAPSCATCWWTSRPYLFRGKLAGFLTRLSAPGLPTSPRAAARCRRRRARGCRDDRIA